MNKQLAWCSCDTCIYLRSLSMTACGSSCLIILRPQAEGLHLFFYIIVYYLVIVEGLLTNYRALGQISNGMDAFSGRYSTGIVALSVYFINIDQWRDA